VTVPERWQPNPDQPKPLAGEWESPPPSLPLETTRVPRPDGSLPPPGFVPAVAANWYPDPTNPGLLRYWDGSQWTEHRSAATPQASAVVYNNVQVRGGGGSDVALHLILTLLTCGLWLPVWLLIEIIKAVSR
jgi:hypothetical protein